MKWQAYRNREPKAQPRQFSNQEALEQIRQVQTELNQQGPWPEGFTTAWLRSNHPSVLQAISKATRGIDDACLNQDSDELTMTLATYKRAWLEGLTLWRASELKREATP